jgi:hypothetical protein
LSNRRGLTARAIAKAVGLAFLALSITATPAAAYIVIPLRDGSYLLVNELAVLVVVGVVAAIVFAVSNFSGSSGDEITEIETPEPTEYYEDRAARARALKRKLDADTELADSFIKAARTKGELDELSEILGHDKVKRLLKRRR